MINHTSKVPAFGCFIVILNKGNTVMHNELTRKDIRDMEEEIEYRKQVVRPKALEDVKVTRAQGDLSENFEYHAAKKFKNENESRIRYLERMIRTARILEDEQDEDQAGINKKVTVFIPEDNEETAYTIVSTIRGNSLKHLISVESPMGKALIGHRAGDTVTVQVNDSYSYEVEIRKVEYAEDAQDAQIRAF